MRRATTTCRPDEAVRLHARRRRLALVGAGPGLRDRPGDLHVGGGRPLEPAAPTARAGTAATPAEAVPEVHGGGRPARRRAGPDATRPNATRPRSTTGSSAPAYLRFYVSSRPSRARRGTGARSSAATYGAVDPLSRRPDDPLGSTSPLVVWPQPLKRDFTVVQGPGGRAGWSMEATEAQQAEDRWAAAQPLWRSAPRAAHASRCSASRSE